MGWRGLCALAVSAIVFVPLRLCVGRFCWRGDPISFSSRRSALGTGSALLLSLRAASASMDRMRPGLKPVAGAVASNFFAVGTGGDYPAERGCGPLAAGADLSQQRVAGRRDFFPIFRALGVGGGWLAQLAANFGIPSFHRRGRRGRGAGGRRADGAVGGVDRRATARPSTPTTESRRRFQDTTSCWFSLAASWLWWAGPGWTRLRPISVLRRWTAAGGRRGDQRDTRGLGWMPWRLWPSRGRVTTSPDASA